MAVTTSESDTATVKLVGATDDFSGSESEAEDEPTGANVVNGNVTSQQDGIERESAGAKSASTNVIPVQSPNKERFNPFDRDSSGTSHSGTMNLWILYRYWGGGGRTNCYVMRAFR